jgi:hypothetical protein
MVLEIIINSLALSFTWGVPLVHELDCSRMLFWYLGVLFLGPYNSVDFLVLPGRFFFTYPRWSLRWVALHLVVVFLQWPWLASSLVSSPPHWAFPPATLLFIDLTDRSGLSTSFWLLGLVFTVYSEWLIDCIWAKRKIKIKTALPFTQRDSLQCG